MVEGEAPVYKNNAPEQGSVDELFTQDDVNGFSLQAELPKYLLNWPMDEEVEFAADDSERPMGWQACELEVDVTKPVQSAAVGNYKYLGQKECRVTFRKPGEKIRRIKFGRFAVFSRIKYGTPSYYFFQIPADSE